MMKPRLYIAIPAMDELNYLPSTLSAIARQKTTYPFSVFICINQPDDWWNNDQKRSICLNNQKLHEYLRNYDKFPIHILDRSSKGKGWQRKNYGVGWARKILAEEICDIAALEDIMIMLDADTVFDEHYLESIGDNFIYHKKYPVISVPYYHLLTGDETADRAVLRYEIYLRNWLLNMMDIGSPYGFTALGSAIAIKIWALQKIGGITPLRSGEDFYLLQKLRKMSLVNIWNRLPVYPAARFSDRVAFGTGPAMAKGAGNDWKSYPVYHHTLFKPISHTYQKLDELFIKDIDNPFLRFLREQFKDDKIWIPIRKNFKKFPLFLRAFHEKADGLRIIQFIKQEHAKSLYTDEFSLKENMGKWMGNDIPEFLNKDIMFENMTLEELSSVREILWNLEKERRLLWMLHN